MRLMCICDILLHMFGLATASTVAPITQNSHFSLRAYINRPALKVARSVFLLVAAMLLTAGTAWAKPSVLVSVAPPAAPEAGMAGATDGQTTVEDNADLAEKGGDGGIADEVGKAAPATIASDKVLAVPTAENIDLSEPLESPKPVSVNHDSFVPELPEQVGEETADRVRPSQAPLIILGTEVPPGTATRLSWEPDQSFEGIAAPTPVLVVNGQTAGPTLCLTAAIHGDELNGIEIVRRVLYEVEPEKLSGALIGVPIVNLHGFHRNSRYLPDRRDLNRFFPGNPIGSSASRIAYSFFNQIIRRCDALVDLHTGSFRRTNLPQVRADLRESAIVELSQSFGATVVLHSGGAEGTLRRAAAHAGIPAITLEAGGPMRLQKDAVDHGVKGIETLLDKMQMYSRFTLWGEPQPVFYRSRWIRANGGGLLFSEVELGERVSVGELLGTVTDPITNVRSEIFSPFTGRVLGRALDQVVLPGFAAFRIGIETTEEDMQKESPTDLEDSADLDVSATDRGDSGETPGQKYSGKQDTLLSSNEEPSKDDAEEASE